MQNNKKTFGQVFTNPVIADFMINMALSKDAETFLDPAVGEGVFTSIVNKKMPVMDITACEIDSSMIVSFKEKNHYAVNLLECDYLSTYFDKKFDCIVCNPPYNRFQEIKNRDIIRADFAEKYNVKMIGFSNICVYFLVKSINEMADNGKCCFIMPYEFLNAGYGVVVKQYLLESGCLEKIIKFSNKLNLFDEAVTTSCILLLHKVPHDKVELININDKDELLSRKFSSTREFAYSELNPKEKWICYFNFDSKEKSETCFEKNHENSGNLVSVSEFGRFFRGIATGSNDFFILNKSMKENLGLSDSVCIPCIMKSRVIKDVVVTNETIEKMISSDKMIYLFDGSRAEKKEDFDYIAFGEEYGVNKAYLTRHRNPWYLIENKEPAPILLAAFNRGKIKVIRNEAMVKNLTAFHVFYPKNKSNDFANLMFCYLLTPLAQEMLYLNKREYGAGLEKFEPGDLNRAVMLDLRILSSDDVNSVLEIYEKIRNEQKPVEIKRLNSIFQKYI